MRRLDRRSSDGTMANVQGEEPALRVVPAFLEGLGWGLLEGSACLEGGGCPEGVVGLPCGDIRPYSCISAL